MTGSTGDLLVAEAWETIRLALGAFLTSAGFGGLATALAAYLALRGVRERIRHDAEQAASDRADGLTGDARRRWWELAMYVDGQLDASLNPSDIERLMLLVENMTRVPDLTEEQAGLAELLLAKAVKLLPPDPEEE